MRPALDLLAQVDRVPEGPVVDLGCGNGAVGDMLVARFGKRIVGVDSSPAMLAEAAATGAYTALIEADIATWRPAVAPAVIFSNAALHWLPAHHVLLPRLAALLAPGGVLAVQMPNQVNAPSHALLRQIVASMFPGRFDVSGHVAPVHAAETYHAMLAPLGKVAIWETTYLQTQPAVTEGHPVRAFTESTAMRPIVAGMTVQDAAAFTAAYDAALLDAYPLLADGSALFPFRRLFLTLTV